MTKFFNKFKKSLILAHFWSLFSSLGNRNYYSRKSASVTINFIWENLEKASDTSGRKYSDRKKDRQEIDSIL